VHADVGDRADRRRCSRTVETSRARRPLRSRSSRRDRWSLP
jgi:hypothetical protein